MKKSTLLSLVVFCIGMTANAQTVWWETFDSYNLGPLAPQGGWEEWQGGTGVNAQVINSLFLTESNSIHLQGDDGSNPGGDDVVYDFTQLAGGAPNSGVWSISVRTYIPSGTVGQGWFIMLNTYPTSDNQDWSCQVMFEATRGEVLDRSGRGGRGSRQPIQFDQWVTLTVCVDLDNNRMDVFYGGNAVRTGASWAPSGRNTINAVNLYAGAPGANEITDIYFDNLRLERVEGECTALEMLPNPAVGGSDTLTINIDSPQLPNAPAAIFSWSVAGFPYILPVLFVNLDSNGKFTLSGPVPGGTPMADVGFRAFTLGANGVVGSNEDLILFR